VNNTFKVLQQDAHGEFLPISLLNDFVFCPRRAALKAIEGWREANEHNKPSVAVHRNNNPLGSFSNFAFRDALIPRRILEPEKNQRVAGRLSDSQVERDQGEVYPELQRPEVERSRPLNQLCPLTFVAAQVQCIGMKTFKFTAIIEGDRDGYYAYCPELKGCQTQGDTVEDALANLREAAELYIETLSPDELEALAAAPKTILSTSLELTHAQTAAADSAGSGTPLAGGWFRPRPFQR